MVNGEWWIPDPSRRWREQPDRGRCVDGGVREFRQWPRPWIPFHCGLPDVFPASSDSFPSTSRDSPLAIHHLLLGHGRGCRCRSSRAKAVDGCVKM